MRLSEHVYRSISSIRGPLVFLDGVVRARFGEVVRIIAPDGTVLGGEVIKIDGATILLQLFGEPRGLDTSVAVSLSDAARRAPLSPAAIGRIFNGSFLPIDDEPGYVPKSWRPWVRCRSGSPR